MVFANLLEGESQKIQKCAFLISIPDFDFVFALSYTFPVFAILFRRKRQNKNSKKRETVRVTRFPPSHFLQCAAFFCSLYRTTTMFSCSVACSSIAGSISSSVYIFASCAKKGKPCVVLPLPFLPFFCQGTLH